MKSTKIFLTLVFTLLLALPILGQNDFATLIIYRPANLVLSGEKANIYINGKQVCYLRNGGKLEYTLLTTGQTHILVKGVSIGFTLTTTFNLVSEKGHTYYLRLKPKSQIITGYFEISQTEGLKRGAKLQRHKFITASDIPVPENPSSKKSSPYKLD